MELRPDVTEFDVRNDVFFRLNSGALIEAELTTTNEDVPVGAPILQHLCYELPPPWYLHVLEISVWQHLLTAKIGRKGEVLIFLHFTKWDDGWLLSIDPMKNVDRTMFRDFIGHIADLISDIPDAYDTRWYASGVLTCGVMHDGDFERGFRSPFIAN